MVKVREAEMCVGLFFRSLGVGTSMGVDVRSLMLVAPTIVSA